MYQKKSLTESLNLLKSLVHVLIISSFVLWVIVACKILYRFVSTSSSVLSHQWSGACRSTAEPENTTLTAFHSITLLVRDYEWHHTWLRFLVIV